MKLEKIQSIEYLKDIPEYVYNIEVEDNHNYYVNGVLTHNCDDIQNPKTAESEIKRQDAINFWLQSLFNRATPERLALRVNIQQRLHTQDLSGHLLDEYKEEYRHICLPAEISDLVTPPELKDFYKDGLLDPVRLGPKTLVSFKKALGSRGFAGQYEQTPTGKEGGIINPEWFDILEPHQVTRDIRNEPSMFTIDPAYTMKTENDPTAIFTCFKQGNFLYVLDVSEQWLEFPALCTHIVNHTMNYQYTSNSKIFIEPKASGLSIQQQLSTTTKLNVIKGENPDSDKIVRTHAITPLLESRRVKLINGPYIKKFLEQCKNFPNAEHDDMVDTLTMAVNELLVKSGPDFFFL